LRQRVYWHVMPSYKQAKLTAWDMLKHFARPIPGVKFNEAELLVRYPNGSRLQLIGADNPDSLRGPGLSGVSLDEYSQHPPNVFGEVLSKALADHLGYAIFAGTIKGTDQLYTMYETAKGKPDWFALWQNIDVSLASEEGTTIAALQTALEDDRKLVLQGLMTQAEYDQEWYLSPEAAIKGAWYAEELNAARVQGRITRVPHDPSLPVDTDWDLGIDAMAIWFTQSLRSGEVRVIDYHEDIGGGLPACAKVLKDKGYTYGAHWAPHDIEQREIASGLTRKQTAASLGIQFRVVDKIAVEDGIHAVRLLLARCWFDETRCRHGLDALRRYRRTYNQRLNEFTATPVHDCASHAADAFRGFAVRYQQPREKRMPPWAPVSSSPF
jgi:phage terminase large subunit